VSERWKVRQEDGTWTPAPCLEPQRRGPKPHADRSGVRNTMLTFRVSPREMAAIEAAAARAGKNAREWARDAVVEIATIPLGSSGEGG
jgi:hypothetical protein